jgi:hypothetical protein
MPGAGRHTPSLKLPIAAALAFLVGKSATPPFRVCLRAFIFRSMAAFALFNSYKVANSLARRPGRSAPLNQLNRLLPKGATVAGTGLRCCNRNKCPCALYKSCVNRPGRFWEPAHLTFFIATQCRSSLNHRKFDWLKLGLRSSNQNTPGQSDVVSSPLPGLRFRRPAENEPEPGGTHSSHL